ncbi:MAG: trigger factor [Nitrospinae bacterium RIFCSPLOWO2_12_FULL_47_7]|nr:MAG: trigger factor [Nitrospinae bacterium RIFCSPLOWO2_12_FULL_47_7]
MELVVEELDALKRKLKIKIPLEIITQRINNAYKEMNNQIRMPGFRPGKIPRSILEKQVPIQSFTKMYQELMQEYYEKALKETGITPVGEPEIDHSDLKEIKQDSPLSFTVVLDIKPDITLKPYKGWLFKKREATVSDEELATAISGIITPFGQLEPHSPDHPVERGDYVVIDFDGFLRDEPLEKGNARNYVARIGENKMIAGFEDQLVGHKQGESFDVKLPLPQNWNNKLRRFSMPVPGATDDKDVDIALFKVKLHEVKKMVLPELTDEFVRRNEFKVESVEHFRRAVKSDLQAHKEGHEEFRIKEDIFNKLVAEHDIKPPDTMVNRELRYMIEGMKYQIERSGMKLEDSGFDPEQAKKELREKAEFNVKGYMILDAIAKQENLHVASSDMEEEYKRLARETKQKPDDIKQRLLSNAESLNQTLSKLLGQKALNFVYSNCEFEYVKD